MGGYQAYTGNPWPDYTAWVENAWGAGEEGGAVGGSAFWASASNFVFGANPPYFLDDFLAFYPKFFGPATTVAGCATTAGSAVVSVPSLNGLGYGQFVQGSGLPKGTVITGMAAGQITVSTVATTTATGVALSVYEQPPIPLAVVQMYVNLAAASLVQRRWQDQWAVAMAWFIAHYCTLFARSDATEVMSTLQTTTHGEAPTGAVPGTVYTLSGPPPGGALQALTLNGKFLVPGAAYALNGAVVTLAAPTVAGDVLWATWPVQQAVFQTNAASSGAQIAAQGLAGGIQTSKSVGDVSVSYQVLTSLEDWGAWNLTSYGQLFATAAKTMGAGPALLW